MTPPEKLRQIAGEMEAAKARGDRDVAQVAGWRDRLVEIVAAMDAALDPVEFTGSLARQQRKARRKP